MTDEELKRHKVDHPHASDFRWHEAPVTVLRMVNSFDAECIVHEHKRIIPMEDLEIAK